VTSSLRAVLPVTVAAVLALAGCVPASRSATPEPTATPTVATTSSPGPTAEPTAEPTDRPDRIGIDTAVFVIGGPDDPEVAVFEYFQPAAAAIAALTEAFGEPPVVTEHPGGLETAPSTEYDWGGFTLTDPDGVGEAPLRPDFWVRATAPTAHGIPIIAHVALQVGTPMAEAIAVQDGSTDAGSGVSVAWIFAQSIDPAEVGEPAGTEISIFVAVRGPAGGTITEIVAPASNAGS
jgi:hypothetical protein